MKQMLLRCAAITLCLTANPSSGGGDGSAAKDVLQFALHTQTPLGVNFAMQRREQIMKWDKRPNLVISAPADLRGVIKEYLEGAGSIIGDNLGLEPKIKRLGWSADIVVRIYEGEMNTRTELHEVLTTYFDADLDNTGTGTRLSELTDLGSGCTTWFFDRMTDLQKADLFVSILIDLKRTSPEELRACIYEELGHAMTFFQDIPTNLEVEGEQVSFSTLFQHGPEEFDTFSPSDLRMMQLLGSDKISNGTFAFEANDILSRTLGLD